MPAPVPAPGATERGTRLWTIAFVVVLGGIVAVAIGGIASMVGVSAHSHRQPEVPVTVTPEAVGPAPAGPARRVLPAPTSVVGAYYAALDARRFERAWSMLGPAVHARFGGFAGWRDGFATTLASRPTRLRVTRAGRRAVVTLLLVAADRAPCGVLHRSFAVRWVLRPAGARWIAASVSARPAAGGGGSGCATR